MSAQSRKITPLIDDGKQQASMNIGNVVTCPTKTSNSMPSNVDASWVRASEQATSSLQVLSCTQFDNEKHLEAFMELHTHYKIPSILLSTFSQESLDSIFAALKMSQTSFRSTEVQLLALLVLKQIATQGIFIGTQGIVDIEPFLQNNDSRLRNEALRILAITADGKADLAQFIVTRPDITKGITRSMTEANNAEELESSLIAFAVLCRESAKSGILLPLPLPATIRVFFQEFHDVPDILSKKLLIILLEVLDGLLGGPLEQIRVVIDGGTVSILFRLIRNHHPKRHRHEETRAVTIWSLRCLQRIAIHQKICMAAFGRRLPELAELLRCVLAAAPGNAKVEGCDFLTKVVASCPLFLPSLISGKYRLLKFLIDSADVDEGHEDAIVDSSMQALSTMIHQGSEETVASIVNYGVLKVFTDFLARRDPNNVMLLTDVLYAIERVCEQRLGGEFYGWDQINDLATSFHHREVSSTAQRIHSTYCPNGHCELHESENDIAVRNLFSGIMITPSSKRRRICNDVPILGISNRR